MRAQVGAVKTAQTIPDQSIHCPTYLLSGCALAPDLSYTTNNASDKESGQVMIGSYLTIQNTDERLKLSEQMDALSADGLYYASWVAGDSTPYENSDGESVSLYDAQLYLLAGEFKSTEAAQANMDNWLAAGKSNYEVMSEEDINCNNQSYCLITYQFNKIENPYDRGVSVFGIYEDMAVCMELTCVEDYDEDLRQMLTDFLENCTYH